MAGQIIPRGKHKWVIRVFLGREPETGKRQYYNETVDGTKKDAEDKLLTALQNQKQGTIAMGLSQLTISDLLDDVVRDYRVHEQSVDWCNIVVNVHLRPFFGTLAVSKFLKNSTAYVQSYIDARLAKGRKNATINRELSMLRRAFNLGAECVPPKVSTVPKIGKLTENNVRTGFFEHENYLALLKTLPDELRPVLTFAYCTGCRKGEILSLRWTQVDMLEQIIRLEPGTTKNGEARSFYMPPGLYEMLKKQKAIRDALYPNCPWVFFRDGEQILDFRGAWEEACKAAGLWTTEEGTGKPSKLFHDLRRSGVRNLIRSGVPTKTAMKISGHKTMAVFERYNIIDESDLKDAAQKVGRYLQEKTNALEAPPLPTEQPAPGTARIQ